MEKHWYVLHVYSGYEKYVMRTLNERIEIENLGEHFGQIIIPTEDVVEMKSGQKRKSERKFFPGYVLIEMDMNDEIWHFVHSAPKVLGFVGGRRGQPAPLSQAESDLILQKIETGNRQIIPKIIFEAGEMIRVIDGPFNDFNGVVEEVNYEKSRVKISVVIFGRSTPVDLNFSQVEKI